MQFFKITNKLLVTKHVPLKNFLKKYSYFRNLSYLR